jgi:16S rRNA (adenine1518-N6/adenine1519-N6)-dimethyltransferase
MKLSEMRQVLTARDIQLTKSLGQNFLHDANQLRRIADAAALVPTDKVLEIGPGLGPLTQVLLERVGQVLAIEKDRRLVEVLREVFQTALATGAAEGRGLQAASTSEASVAPVLSQAPEANSAKRPEGRAPQAGTLTLLHDDALDYLRRKPRDWSDWKLVANLPYSVASPILVELAQAQRGPQRLVATLQIEVAKRLMAPSGNADYGVLTLLVQLDYEPSGWFKIPASCFFPEPDVGSACVCLPRRAEPLLPTEQRESFNKIVKRAFSQRRKMMLKLLKQDWRPEELERAFAQVGLSPTTRAEAVSLEQFVGLTRQLCR